jgi:predicted Zn-dependent protease
MAGEQPFVRMTAAECFAQEETIHLVNSRGIDANQVSTRIDIEWVFLSQKDGKEAESFVEMTRRRVSDLDLEAEIQRRARYAVDLLQAVAPPSYQGPVVLRGATLGDFVNSGVLSFLGSGEARFQKITPWEIGQPVFKGEVKGDSLSVWANRQLSYGTHSDCFDTEGIPAQRVALIQENKLAAFTANQRYADYLSIPVTGGFGNMELPAGTIPAEELLAGAYVEVAAFSWFNPDPVTGEFASEIRLGYVVDGDKRIPFKGGMLVGNLLDALANVRWSAEVGFYGSYQGPAVARFADLKVTGK